MPQLAHRVLNEAAEGRLRVTHRSPEVDVLRRELREHNRRTVAAVSGGSLLVSGALVTTLGPKIVASALLGGGLLAIGTFLLARAAWGRGD